MLRKRIPTGLAGAVFWLAIWLVLLWLVRHASLPGHTFLAWMQVLVGVALAVLSLALLVSLVRRHLLWRLRNKLIITYILIGLAPFVLFLILVGLSAYVAAGQFSIHLADTRMRQQLDEIGSDNSSTASNFARIFGGFGGRPFAAPAGNQGPRRPPFGRPPGRPPQRPAPSAATRTAQRPAPLPGQSTQQSAQTAAQAAAAAAALGETAPNPLLRRLHRQIYLNGQPMNFPGSPAPAAPSPTANNAVSTVPLGLPVWAADLHRNQFRNLVLDDDNLFLVAIDQRHLLNGDTLTVVTSLPVDRNLMDIVADGLGRVQLSTILSGNPKSPAEAAQTIRLQAHHLTHRDIDKASIFGGEEPARVGLLDFGVPFFSTTDIRDWETNELTNVPIEVHSRPSVLYRQLFGSSLSGFVTTAYRTGFIILCILFALIEAVALWAALRLSRQITTSVEELYAGTQRVDRGDLTQRIPALAAREDQLGELSRSFNRMTGSLERLLVEQQEKERLQGELAIAQEVQANLFPHRVHNLPTLELHGVCRPARIVSGDYYDFFVFHGPGSSENAQGPETGVGISIGDISGKGISAALLMATLHSAVRAYRLVSEDLAASDDAVFAAGISGHAPRAALMESEAATAASAVAEESGSVTAGGAIFASPARILSLVNRHLYTSTQTEKYATLLLAHYDAASARLTYSNAGHLSPIILGRDGSIRRLDRGGTVVGLFPRVNYEEASIVLRSGDILIGYSDGITEPENDFGEFGEARLIETVARYHDQPLQLISAQVMLALDGWIGAAEQPDDITLVLARQI
jgi:sigma-B regulation protein RsbU (phosphoserine phosphatase)